MMMVIKPSSSTELLQVGHWPVSSTTAAHWASRGPPWAKNEALKLRSNADRQGNLRKSGLSCSLERTPWRDRLLWKPSQHNVLTLSVTQIKTDRTKRICKSQPGMEEGCHTSRSGKNNFEHFSDFQRTAKDPE